MTSNKKQQLRLCVCSVLGLLSFLSILCLDNSQVKIDNSISLNLLEVSAQSTQKTTYYVSPQGSNSNPGTATQPWRNINYAVGVNSPVKAGDTILVQPGNYTELITLRNSGNSSGHITLKANGNVILRDPDANNGGFREGVIQSAGQGFWIIDGFRIENTSWAGIALRNANNMIVQNNHTYQTGSSGIIILPETYYNGGELEITSRNIKVLRNTVERANWRWKGNSSTEGTQEALSIWGVDGFEVAYNTLIEGNREGIDAKVGARNGSIHDNVVTRQALISGKPQGYNGGPAIYIDGNRAKSFKIDIYNNTDAIAIADEDPKIGDVSDIRVYNNVIYSNGIKGVNGGVGIIICQNVRNVEIVNNTMAKNVQALVINGNNAATTGGYQPYNIKVRNNIFGNSTYRNAYIAAASNLVINNNLFANSFSNLYDNGGKVQSLSAWNNNKVALAGFVDLNGNNFRLSSTSPAINAGSSNNISYIKFDKDNNSRIQSTSIDIGAYESNGTQRMSQN
jgi:Right handed beta helix region